MSTVIGVVAKAPEPGRVKTRLSPPLTPAQAAQVAGAMLSDTVRAAVATGLATWCVGAGDSAALVRALPVLLPVLLQRGDDLGQRLAAAQADLFAAGYREVVLLAGDCPTVGPGYLAAAVGCLADRTVVLGPVRDGGYSLIATRAPTPELFTTVPMSTPRTLEATVTAARGAGLDVRVLPVRRDLDTVHDLIAAARGGELAGAAATQPLVSRLLPGATPPASGRAAVYGEARTA